MKPRVFVILEGDWGYLAAGVAEGGGEEDLGGSRGSPEELMASSFIILCVCVCVSFSPLSRLVLGQNSGWTKVFLSIFAPVSMLHFSSSDQIIRCVQVHCYSATRHTVHAYFTDLEKCHISQIIGFGLSLHVTSYNIKIYFQIQMLYNNRERLRSQRGTESDTQNEI